MLDKVCKEDVGLEFIIKKKSIEVFIVCGYRGGNKRGKFGPFSFKVSQ